METELRIFWIHSKWSAIEFQASLFRTKKMPSMLFRHGGGGGEMKWVGSGVTSCATVGAWSNICLQKSVDFSKFRGFLKNSLVCTLGVSDVVFPLLFSILAYKWADSLTQGNNTFQLVLKRLNNRTLRGSPKYFIMSGIIQIKYDFFFTCLGIKSQLGNGAT